MLNRRRFLLAALEILGAVVLGVILLGSGRARTRTGEGPSESVMSPVQGKTYRRIVSLAPSITESLFALGLGDRVVGVTSFCDYPPEALAKSKVGGYYDLNYEAIVALEPDLVVCLPEHEGRLADLDRLNLPHLTVDHRRVEAILESLATLGRVCGVEERAEELVKDIRGCIAAVQNRTIDQSRPRVLLCVGRNMGSAAIDDVYIAGRGGFYDEMIVLAGGINAYEGQLDFPVVTGEGLLRLQPDVIIDMVPDLQEKGLSKADVLKQWSVLADLPAVRQRRVFLFTEDFVVVPGPRFIQILEKMAAMIHPEGVEQ
ncbi:MAG: ABC transporter substrate-binding protein [Planctomycetota bacterium]|nr:ABC transporter substrate-binding protein [Planctomycetota bacterium]